MKAQLAKMIMHAPTQAPSGIAHIVKIVNKTTPMHVMHIKIGPANVKTHKEIQPMHGDIQIPITDDIKQIHGLIQINMVVQQMVHGIIKQQIQHKQIKMHGDNNT